MAEGNSEGGLPSWILSMVPGLVSSGISAATQGGPRRQYKWNSRLAEEQNIRNRQNAEWLIQQNKALQAEQRAYDSPEAVKQRYIEAGFNPHMIYGGGASGGSAFPFQAGSLPGYNLGQVDASYPDVASSFIGASQAMVGMDYTRARTAATAMSTQVAEVQKRVLESNPMLSPQVSQAVANSMEELAKLKAAEANYSRTAWSDYDEKSGETNRIYVQKIKNEVDAMAQRLGLNTEDLKIRNAVFESKKFANEIAEIQAKWLKDGDISPEHIRQGLMLILGKMMGK